MSPPPPKHTFLAPKAASGPPVGGVGVSATLTNAPNGEHSLALIPSSSNTPLAFPRSPDTCEGIRKLESMEGGQGGISI